jgi:hypothetical protein
VGHSGRNRILEFIKDRFYWPRQRKTIERYIRNYYDCRRVKALIKKYQGLLRPLPILERFWRYILVNFVGPLPESEGANIVIMIIDRITKLRYYIPCHAGEGNLNFKHVIKFFLRYIWKYHGLPDLIVSDRGLMFILYL